MDMTREIAAAEAMELHEFLSENKIPDRIYDEVDGTILGADGRKFYFLSLQDRVMMLLNSFKPTSTMESEVTWTPLNLGDTNESRS